MRVCRYQAGHLFDGELSIEIRICARGNFQMPPQRVLDPLGARHVTRRAATDANDVLAGRLHAEHVVERSDAGDGGGRDIALVANMAQRLLRQIAVVLLQRLQNRDHRIRVAPDACHGLLGKCQINRHEIQNHE